MKLEKDLPNKICDDCVTKLDMADIFKRRCLDSEEILGQYHPAFEKAFLKEVPVEGEPENSVPNLLGVLIKKEEKSAVCANVTVTKNEKSITNFQTVESDITEIQDDVKSLIKVEIESLENGFDRDMENVDNHDTVDVDKLSIEPAKSNKRKAVKVGNILKKEKGKCHTKENGPFICSYCGGAYGTKNSLTAHIAVKHKKSAEKLECLLCIKKFDNKYKYKAHMTRVHASERAVKRNVSCKKCDRKYKFEAGLKRHMEVAHGSDYSCKICGHICANKDVLEEHKKKHSGQQLCPFCGKWILHGAWQDHTLRHKEIKAYQCDQCQKSFVTKGELKIHNRSHTGDQPFLCNICSKAFATSSGMKKHRRTHSDAMPYVCEYCPMRFKFTLNLQRHTRTHTGEKPYKCTVCDAAFSRSHHLTTHMRRHARDTPNIPAVMTRKPGRPLFVSEIKLTNSDSEFTTQ